MGTRFIATSTPEFFINSFSEITRFYNDPAVQGGLSLVTRTYDQNAVDYRNSGQRVDIDLERARQDGGFAEADGEGDGTITIQIDHGDTLFLFAEGSIRVADVVGLQWHDFIF